MMGYAGYCGDGEINGGELCDDGANNGDVHTDKPHCNEDCTDMIVEYCGDSTCQNNESLMTCPEDCTSFCGDGKLQAGEVCDEAGDTATCDGNCSEPSCGDGYLNTAANEECDDGNQDDTDACRKDCTNAPCGDGVIQDGVEDCDDGNQADDDACSDLCVPARRMFVTAGTYAAAAIQGVAGADVRCKTAGAGLAGPGNTWLAWLSDDTSSPSNRVAAANKSFTGWYLLPTGTPVVKGWSGLTSGTLDNPIQVTEAGVMADDPLGAWTNTKSDGTSAGASDCTNWSKTDLTTSGYGDITNTSSAWTQSGTAMCNGNFHLYCLEVSQ
jgi:cysteine-rich repeat protein